VLIGGIFLVLAIVAVVLGIAGLRRPVVAYAGLAVFGVLGILASLSRPESAPVDALDPLTDEMGREIDGYRPPQPPVANHDILDHAALRVGREGTPRDLDFGQLRHARPCDPPRVVLLMCNVSSSPLATGRASPPWPS